VDLQVLQSVDDPAVSAAVDDVLRDPGRYTDIWWGPNEGGEGDKPRAESNLH
jgi:hypothetical protein